MSVSMSNLSKLYGDIIAVHDLTLECPNAWPARTVGVWQKLDVEDDRRDRRGFIWSNMFWRKRRDISAAGCPKHRNGI